MRGALAPKNIILGAGPRKGVFWFMLTAFPEEILLMLQLKELNYSEES